MSTLIKIITASILSLTLSSCNLGLGRMGNGNVITKERSLIGDFDHIEVGHGLDVYLAQSETEHLTVQADENLHDIIMTEVENNTLKIYADENIASSTTKKIMVNFKNVSKISSTSGSAIYSTNTITAENLELYTASGSDMELDIKVNNLNCTASSGSDLTVKGTAHSLTANASSGSDIHAKNLSTQTVNAKSSSGADILVNVSKELTAKAESGGDIIYVGNPEKVNESKQVSGSVRAQ